MSDSFGALLKEWRGQRRMSQLDLGMAADVSARHISFLETGRSKPSQAMVMHLSETLEIPRTVRNRLLNAAGFSVAYQTRDLGDDELEYVNAAMNWTLDRHDPYPAIALDRYWRILRANVSATAMLGNMGITVGESLLDAFAEPGPARDCIDNWAEIARHLIARLRTESAHLGGDPVLDAAIARLADSLEPGETEYSGALPAVITANYRANGMTLRFFSTISQFGSAEDIALADLKIELMFPADAATKAALMARFAQ